MIFNPDMARRLETLHAALTAGEPGAAKYQAPTNGQGYERDQPARVVVSTGPHTLVFAIDMALAVADQIEANGFADAASQIRTEAAKAP